MNRILLLASILVLCLSCSNNTDYVPKEEDGLSTPEQLEKDLIEISNEDWKGLADTLLFFTKEFLFHEKTSGIGPDGVYYSLTETEDGILFSVEDSIFLSIKESANYLYIKACNTDFIAELIYPNGLTITINDIRLETKSITERYIEVFYHNRDCGYIAWEHFENTDYTQGYYPVMHYYGDDRTFAFYENIYLYELWEQIKTIRP